MKIFPKNLNREDSFKTPIWTAYEPSFVKDLNKASDSYIKESQKKLSKDIKTRNKEFGNRGDAGFVYHSTTLLNDPKFSELASYITNTSSNLLTEMGYNLTNFVVFCTELWVQEFAKKGSGYHAPHNHWNGHISGFYFLKTNEKTSKPVFYDPRPGKDMIGLPEIDKSSITYASQSLHYNIKPGTMIFFPSYLTHEYPPDLGYSPFRFIHWNCQAIFKSALDGYVNHTNFYEYKKD
jgi:uncharacterized protein (TIGR02466 family)